LFLLEALLNSPNVICTPSFAAWFSEESLKDLRISAAREVRNALTGAIPESLQVFNSLFFFEFILSELCK